MALFPGDDPNDDSTTGLRPRRSKGSAGERRRGRGLIFLFAALLLGVVLGSIPAPYVIEKPGPVFNTLGEETHDGEPVPLITIPDHKTYPTAGALYLLTVSAVGQPGNLPNWFEVARAWVDPSEAVLPVDQVYAPDQTVDERNQVNQEMMVNSQQEAIAAAFTNLDIAYIATLSVQQVMADSPATGILNPKDVIVSVNGAAVSDITALRQAINDNGTTQAATLGITRDGKPQTVEVTPVESQGSVILGVTVSTTFDFPFDVKIELDNVGGPSAGMMFSLGIIDKLTPGELNGGAEVAGTGTIDAAGNVGPIGGIRQKMYGAKDAGAAWFLAPAKNCSEVVGNIPGDLEVFAVATLDDSLHVLEGIREGTDLDSLARCTTGG